MSAYTLFCQITVRKKWREPTPTTNHAHPNIQYAHAPFYSPGKPGLAHYTTDSFLPPVRQENLWDYGHRYYRPDALMISRPTVPTLVQRSQPQKITIDLVLTCSTI